MTFGEWEVIGHTYREDGLPSVRQYVCRCSCGTEMVIGRIDLTLGKTLQCAQHASRSLGFTSEESNATLYTHREMHRRTNGKSKNKYNYKNYFLKGIKVCDEWSDTPQGLHQFRLDLKDLGWRLGLQIDRIDNNGDYKKSNVRCVTPQANSRNKSNNVALIGEDGTFIFYQVDKDNRMPPEGRVRCPRQRWARVKHQDLDKLEIDVDRIKHDKEYGKQWFIFLKIADRPEHV